MRHTISSAALVLWLALSSLCAPASAQEQAYVHIVRAGESLASIAQSYYGNPRRDAVLIAENGLPEPVELIEGMRLVIPTVRYHRVAQGESWRAIAERYYGDPNRALALLKANNARANAPPEEGAQLLIPYPLRHVVRAGESFASLAASYYRGRDELRLLRAFNGGRAKIARGQLVLVPLFDLTLAPAARERIEQAAGPSGGDLQRLQAEVTRDIPKLRDHVLSGRFVEATALGNQLLGRGQLTGNQEISIERELATAYVALGREDLAIGAFARALEKQPDLELDSVRTSPRVLSALESAKKQRAK